jgi:hypothetical protein
MCHLAVSKDGLGFQVRCFLYNGLNVSDDWVFNATNDTITLHGVNTTQFLQEQSPNVPISREMGEIEAPLTNRKIKKLLGFVEQHDWKKYVKEN